MKTFKQILKEATEGERPGYLGIGHDASEMSHKRIRAALKKSFGLHAGSTTRPSELWVYDMSGNLDRSKGRNLENGINIRSLKSHDDDTIHSDLFDDTERYIGGRIDHVQKKISLSSVGSSRVSSSTMERVYKGLKGEYPDYKIHEYDILRESLQHKVRRILAEEYGDETPPFLVPSGNDMVSEPMGDPFNNPLNINPWDPNFVGPHQVNPGEPFYHDNHWWFHDGEDWWFQDSFGGWWFWDGSKWNRNEANEPIGDDENNPTLDSTEEFDLEEYQRILDALNNPDLTYEEALRIVWLLVYQSGDYKFTGEYDDDGRPIFIDEYGRPMILDVYNPNTPFGGWTWDWKSPDGRQPDQEPLVPDLEDTSNPDELLRWMEGEGWFGVNNRR